MCTSVPWQPQVLLCCSQLGEWEPMALPQPDILHNTMAAYQLCLEANGWLVLLFNYTLLYCNCTEIESFCEYSIMFIILTWLHTSHGSWISFTLLTVHLATHGTRSSQRNSHQIAIYSTLCYISADLVWVLGSTCPSKGCIPVLGHFPDTHRCTWKWHQPYKWCIHGFWGRTWSQREGVISVNQPQDNMKRNYPVVNVPLGLKRSTCWMSTRLPKKAPLFPPLQMAGMVECMTTSEQCNCWFGE